MCLKNMQYPWGFYYQTERRNDPKNRSGGAFIEFNVSCRGDGVGMGSIGVLIREIHLDIEG